jgi:hypothetical protein
MRAWSSVSGAVACAGRAGAMEAGTDTKDVTVPGDPLREVKIAHPRR